MRPFLLVASPACHKDHITQWERFMDRLEIPFEHQLATDDDSTRPAAEVEQNPDQDPADNTSIHVLVGDERLTTLSAILERWNVSNNKKKSAGPSTSPATVSATFLEEETMNMCGNDGDDDLIMKEFSQSNSVRSSSALSMFSSSTSYHTSAEHDTDSLSSNSLHDSIGSVDSELEFLNGDVDDELEMSERWTDQSCTTAPKLPVAMPVLVPALRSDSPFVDYRARRYLLDSNFQTSDRSLSNDDLFAFAGRESVPGRNTIEESSPKQPDENYKVAGPEAPLTSLLDGSKKSKKKNSNDDSSWSTATSAESLDLSEHGGPKKNKREAMQKLQDNSQSLDYPLPKDLAIDGMSNMSNISNMSNMFKRQTRLNKLNRHYKTDSKPSAPRRQTSRCSSKDEDGWEDVDDDDDDDSSDEVEFAFEGIISPTIDESPGTWQPAAVQRRRSGRHPLGDDHHPWHVVQKRHSTSSILDPRPALQARRHSTTTLQYQQLSASLSSLVTTTMGFDQPPSFPRRNISGDLMPDCSGRSIDVSPSIPIRNTSNHSSVEALSPTRPTRAVLCPIAPQSTLMLDFSSKSCYLSTRPPVLNTISKATVVHSDICPLPPLRNTSNHMTKEDLKKASWKRDSPTKKVGRMLLHDLPMLVSIATLDLQEDCGSFSKASNDCTTNDQRGVLWDERTTKAPEPPSESSHTSRHRREPPGAMVTAVVVPLEQVSNITGEVVPPGQESNIIYNVVGECAKEPWWRRLWCRRRFPRAVALSSLRYQDRTRSVVSEISDFDF